MKIYLPLFLLVIWSCSSEPEVVTKPNPEYQQNWKKLNFRGNPEAVYEVNLKYFVPDSSDFPVTRENFYFDDEGKLTQRDTYTEKQNQLYKTTFEYDNAGNIAEIRYYSERGAFTHQTIHTFDSVGNVKEILSKDDKGNILYKTRRKFDTHGNIIEYQQMEPLSPVINKRTYEYDDKGRMTRWEDVNVRTYEIYTYDSTGLGRNAQVYRNNVLASEEKTVKDLKGRLLESSYSYDTTVIQQSYRYDSLGNVLEFRKVQNGAIDSASSYRNEYQYDKQNNWTKRTTSDLAGKPRNSIERTIVY
jgi:uncharacterized protein YcfL